MAKMEKKMAGAAAKKMAAAKAMAPAKKKMAMAAAKKMAASKGMK
jgi:hypothetical protein